MDRDACHFKGKTGPTCWTILPLLKGVQSISQAAMFTVTSHLVITSSSSSLWRLKDDVAIGMVDDGDDDLKRLRDALREHEEDLFKVHDS